MWNRNGNGKPALALQPRHDVPIIGQAFAIKGWFPTVLIACNCGAHESIMVPRGALAQCPGCKKVFSIAQVAFTPDGNVNFGIGVAMPDGTPAAPTEGGTIDG